MAIHHRAGKVVVSSTQLRLTPAAARRLAGRLVAVASLAERRSVPERSVRERADDLALREKQARKEAEWEEKKARIYRVWSSERDELDLRTIASRLGISEHTLGRVVRETNARLGVELGARGSSRASGHR